MDKKIIIEEIKSKGLLPLYYHADQQVSILILEALYAAGIRAVEYTNRGGSALENFRALRTNVSMRMQDLFLGIGTIKNAREAKEYAEAGADFIVSPGIPDDVAAFMNDQEVLWIPGCMTPTEIIRAEQYALKFIKLFPGNLLGPSFIHSIKQIFPGMQFMPTGGVGQTDKDIEEWFAAGVAAVGMGSNLVTPSSVNSGNYLQIKENTLKALTTIAAIRKNNRNN